MTPIELMNYVLNGSVGFAAGVWIVAMWAKMTDGVM